MAGFTIPSIYYPNTVTVNQTFRVDYKLATAGDNTYSLLAASATVNTSGNLSAPIVVTGLPSDTAYYVRFSNNCESPRVYYIQTFTTT